MIFKKKNNSAQIVQTRPARFIKPASFLALADLHNCFYDDLQAIRGAMQNVDAVLCLGDIFENDISWIAKAAKNRGIPLYYVLGNHDTWNQNGNVENAVHLDGKMVEINGIKIAGVSGAPRYKKGNYVMRTNRDVRKKLAKVKDADILISHESPYPSVLNIKSHTGYKAITKYIQHQLPALHLFGHYHAFEEFDLKATHEVCVYRGVRIHTKPYTLEPVL